MYDYDYESSSEEETKVCECCGREIHHGNVYYLINGEILCTDCMKEEYRRLA